MSGDATTSGGVSPAPPAPPAQPARRPALAERARKAASCVVPWLSANAVDLAIMLSLGALSLLVVTLDLEGIGTGGDAIRKWDFVREWFYANDFRHAAWDHHMARFGVHWVTYLVQRILGRGPAMYYVPGLLATAVQVMAVYACGKRLEGRLAGVLAAFCLIYFKATVTAGSQLMPEVFSATYAMVALYLYLRYYDAQGRARTAFLVAMSAVLFVGYLAKETTVFFYPGFVVAIFLARGKRYRDIAIFLAVILAGVLLETAFYRLFTGYGNRMAVIVANHGPEDPKGPRNFMELFNRFSKMDEPWKRAFYSFLPIGIGAAAFAKSRRVWATYVITAGYLFFLTFMIRQLHPFAVWQSFRVRYFDVTSPFVELLTGIFLALVVRELFAPFAERPRVKRFTGSPKWVCATVLALVFLAGLASYSAAAPDLDDHVLRYNARISDVVTDAYVRNLPIVSTRDKRATWVVYAVLIDDKLLAKNGKLPPFDDAKIEEGDRDWLVKEPGRYNLDKLHQLLRAHCAVEVTVKTPGPISEVRPMHRLPASCDRMAE